MDTVHIYSIPEADWQKDSMKDPRDQKLLRPLHRQRTRRRRTAQIMSAPELAEQFTIAERDLEDHLRANDIPYHKDSQGMIWASCTVDE